MLTEDAVIDAVAGHLRERGWEIVSRATAIQRGDDLIAQRLNESLVIEAKGAGSSTAGTARYGSPFNSGQVFDHVAQAVLKGLRVAAAGHLRPGIALPDDRYHRREVELVMPALARIEIVVFWMADDRTVNVEGHWRP